MLQLSRGSDGGAKRSSKSQLELGFGGWVLGRRRDAVVAATEWESGDMSDGCVVAD